jgi:hypothetical protein
MATAAQPPSAFAEPAKILSKFAASYPNRVIALSGLCKLNASVTNHPEGKITMQAIEPAPSIVAIGRACTILQAMPDRIREAAAELNIQPAMIINLVPHYAEVDLKIIGEHLFEQARSRDLA